MSHPSNKQLAEMIAALPLAVTEVSYRGPAIEGSIELTTESMPWDHMPANAGIQIAEPPKVVPRLNPPWFALSSCVEGQSPKLGDFELPELFDRYEGLIIRLKIGTSSSSKLVQESLEGPNASCRRGIVKIKNGVVSIDYFNLTEFVAMHPNLWFALEAEAFPVAEKPMVPPEPVDTGVYVSEGPVSWGANLELVPHAAPITVRPDGTVLSGDVTLPKLFELYEGALIGLKLCITDDASSALNHVELSDAPRYSGVVEIVNGNVKIGDVNLNELLKEKHGAWVGWQIVDPGVYLPDLKQGWVGVAIPDIEFSPTISGYTLTKLFEAYEDVRIKLHVSADIDPGVAGRGLKTVRKGKPQGVLKIRNGAVFIGDFDISAFVARHPRHFIGIKVEGLDDE